MEEDDKASIFFKARIEKPVPLVSAFPCNYQRNALNKSLHATMLQEENSSHK
jgi:hypothetical protein